MVHLNHLKIEKMTSLLVFFILRGAFGLHPAPVPVVYPPPPPAARRAVCRAMCGGCRVDLEHTPNKPRTGAQIYLFKVSNK